MKNEFSEWHVLFFDGGWLDAILAQASTGHLFLAAPCRTMWPPPTTTTVEGVLSHYSISASTWAAFCQAVVDPRNDLRLVASMPSSMVAEAASQCRLPSGRRFSPVEAIGYLFSIDTARWLIGLCPRSTVIQNIGTSICACGNKSTIK